MKRLFRRGTSASSLVLSVALLPLVFVFATSGVATANDAQPTGRTTIVTVVPEAVAVRGVLPPPPADTTDLKFREFFTMPVGPRGLESTEKLLSLNGKRIRIVGYMVQESASTPGLFILAPLPVSIGDEDESLSDDLPASSIFVHIESANPQPVPYMAGLLVLSGTLSLGAQEETGGRVSAARLQLDAEITQTIIATQKYVAARKAEASLQQSRSTH